MIFAERVEDDDVVHSVENLRTERVLKFLQKPLAHILVPTLAALPERIDTDRYLLSPVLGATSLMEQVRQVKPAYHVFGHSHVNVYREVEGIRFVNNAYGYPSEARFTRKRLVELDWPESVQS